MLVGVGEPSDLQIKSFKESQAKINIWEGAVRSGKTYISLWRFLTELAEGPEGEYVLITRTYDSFKRNVLPELTAMIGSDAKYYKGNREMHIYGKTIHIVGADDERAESKIRGPTFSGAYVDEITIIPESVFKMLISRCAMRGAKIFGTTNPDSPYHWLKRDYLIDNPDVKSWQFKLDDNPELAEEDKLYLKRQYKGLWYQRFIEGKWVQAEGSIYDYFDEKLHVIDFAPSYTSSYIVGVDYGTTNPCAFVLVGHDPNRFPNFWVEDEYYFDSRAEQRQKTDSEYAADLQKFLAGRVVKSIYIDPSAVSFRMELQKQGIMNLYEAENEVIDGIRFVSKLLNNGTLKICRSCKNLIKEFQSYVWDDKAAKNGIDKPKKENDHCFVAGTLVSTEKGERPIETVEEGELALTPIGYKKVLKKWEHEAEVSEFDLLGIKIQCTPSHKFFTFNRGFIEASNLLQSDTLLINMEEPLQWDRKKRATGTEENIDGIQMLRDGLKELTSAVLDHVHCSIEMFGSTTLGKYHPDTIFITKTGIPPTTTLAISNYSALETTFPFIQKILLKKKESFAESMQKILDTKLKHGIEALKDTYGTKNMEKTSGKILRERKSASSAQSSTSPQNSQIQSFVRIHVNQNGEETITLIMRIETAYDVVKHLKQTNIKKDCTAGNPVRRKHIGKRKVYNVTVEEAHQYFASNLLVLNCLDALRYALFTHLFGKDEQRLSANEIDRMERDALGGGAPNLPRFFQDSDFGMR